MARESSGGWWEEVRGSEGVLPRRGIEWGLTTEGGAAGAVDLAGGEEDEVGAMLWWTRLPIGWRFLLVESRGAA